MIQVEPNIGAPPTTNIRIGYKNIPVNIGGAPKVPVLGVLASDLCENGDEFVCKIRRNGFENVV